MPSPRRLRWPVASALLSLLLAACQPAAAPPPAAVAPVAAAAPTTTSATASAKTCPLLQPPFSTPQGQLSVAQCAASADDDEAPIALRFIWQQDGQQQSAVYALDPQALAAASETPRLQRWGERLLTWDLPQERGGLLVIAHWTGQRFALSDYVYRTGDEDDMDLSFQDGALVVRTEPDGARKLLPHGSSGEAFGYDKDAYGQAAVQCMLRTGSGVQHSLRLALDMSQQVTSLAYLSSTPDSDGAAPICSVDAADGDGLTEWEHASKDRLDVRFVQEAQEPEPPASQVQVRRQGPRYAVTLQVHAPDFCGPAAALAERVVLSVGAAECTQMRADGSDWPARAANR